jgi:uncharacterized protein (DUF433 family)
MSRKAALKEPWKPRLYIPTYQVQEAARYARTSAQTIRNWQVGDDLIRAAVSSRDPRAALSYLQLIEVAVVVAFRKAGIKLPVIRAARNYLAAKYKKEFPFAQFDFKTSGADILVDYAKLDPKGGKGKLLDISAGGQLVWHEIVAALLKDFEYDKTLALRWHVAGAGQPIIIDPRVSFGAPNVEGVPTWVVKGRWEAGEEIGDIAEDFSLSDKLVKDALIFEGVDPRGQRSAWVH